ncbi:ferritin-like domain-containing protein [Mycena floridula]|nr:ferritin-like domain-containing protein [Mycena floridula]
MRFTILFALLTASALAYPVIETRSDVDDGQILNFALTLEHIENKFYHDALAKFNQQAFLDAGLPSFARDRFLEVAAHEQAHVDFLTKALKAAGVEPTKPCTYKFPYTDPKSFAALSQIIEGVGTSAYLGAAAAITNKGYLTAAGAILTTEARHAAWVASAVDKGAAWSGALDVPLGLNQIYSLVVGFIVECPSTNPALPVKAFPALTVSPAAPHPGDIITVSYPGMSQDQPLFAVFFSGLDKIFVPVQNGKVEVPKTPRGQIYMVLSSSGTDASDSFIVAGPYIIVITTNSKGQVV